MKILLLGGSGQLGQDLQKVFRNDTDYEVYAPDHKDISLRDFYLEKTNILREEAFDYLINCAAFHNVLDCERMPEVAFLENAIIPGEIAKQCSKVGTQMIHISTDYVFGGKDGKNYLRNFKEYDLARPLMVYGASKYAGESLVMANCEHSYIFRVSGLYGINPCRAKKGANFVNTMLRLGAEKGTVTVVSNQFCNPTNTYFLSKNILKFIEQPSKIVGIHHLATAVRISWYNFAKLIFAEAKMNVEVLPSLLQDSPCSFARPYDTSLDSSNLARIYNISIPFYTDQIHYHLKERGILND